jgi:hypothetical protein
MARVGWTAEVAGAFTWLRGARVASWTGVEMALREEGPGGGP